MVSFNVPPPFIITPTGVLPAVQQPARLDGTTQPGFAGTPVVRLIGTSPASSGFGITLQAGGSILRGLSIERFYGGVEVLASSCRVENCSLRTNTQGVVVSSGTNVVIGGTAASNMNVIANNGGDGIAIEGPGVRGTLIQGNRIGVDDTGLLPAGNKASGIRIEQSDSNTVGGAAAGAGNVIAANGQHGVWVAVGVSNVVAGNRIGVDLSGMVALGNTNHGVFVEQAPHTSIGGGLPGDRNLIGGNREAGVWVDAASPFPRIRNNVVGLASNLVAALGNGAASNGHGVAVWAAGGVIASNWIGGNAMNGVLISGPAAVSNVVLGNRIGLGAGSVRLPNAKAGLEVVDAAYTQAGGAGETNRNVISGNDGDGVIVRGAGAQGAAVENNFIGSDLAGQFARTNAGNGLVLSGVTNVLVADNLIGGNTLEGVFLYGGGGRGVRLRANLIGVATNGLSALPNGESGVRVGSDTSFATVGGMVGSNRNVISANGAYGVYLGSGTTNIFITANYIGLTTNGTSRLGNARSGVYIDGGRDHWIGVTNTGSSGNTIAGNRESGVYITGGGPTNVTLVFNRIGVNASSDGPLSNNQHGVVLDQAPGRHRIGLPGAGNQIGGNGLSGLLISDSGQSYAGTVIAANRIGHTIFGDYTPNRRFGIDVLQAVNLVIGQSTNGNSITYNLSNGVHAVAAHGLVVTGNYIGTLFGGFTGAGNLGGGVWCEGPMTNVVIARNIISANQGAGVRVRPDCRDFRIEGNAVGLDAATNFLVNFGPGVVIDNSERIQVGGTGPGQGNHVALVADKGVIVTSVVFGLRAGNRITGNRFSGTLQAIDLQNDGPTTNDPAPDADGNVANELQNFPVLTASFIGSTHVTGRLVTAPGPYLVDVMAVGPSLADSRHLGQVPVTVGPSGTQSFNFVFSAAVPVGAQVGATATDTNGNTSELGPLVTNVLPPAGDTDGDGLPDWWENMHGLNAGVFNTFTNDADGDGTTDLNEFQADTHPTDAASVLEFVSTGLSPAPQVMAWISSDTRAYRVEYAQSVTSTVWNLISNNIAGTGGLLLFTDSSASSTSRIYRVQGGQP